MNTNITLVVDTNTLLHYQRIDSVDWRSLTGADAVDIIVFPKLLSELSDHQVGPKPHLRRRADTLIKWLDKFDEEQRPEIREGVHIQFVYLNPMVEIDELHRTFLADDVHFVAMATKLIREGKNVAVASRDGGVRLQCKGMNIRRLKLPDSLLLPPEADEAQRKIQQLQQDNALLRNKLPILQLALRSTRDIYLSPDPDDFEKFLTDEMGKANAAFPMHEIVDAYTFAMQTPRPPYSRLSPQQNNEAVAEYRIQQMARLKEIGDWNLRHGAVNKVAFHLENSGRARATEIRLTVGVEEPFTFIPGRSVPIYRPPHERPNFGHAPNFYQTNIDQMMLEAPLHPDRPLFTVRGNAATLNKPAVPHNGHIVLPNLWLNALHGRPDDEIVVWYEIMCDESGEAFTGRETLKINSVRRLWQTKPDWWYADAGYH